MDRKPLSGKKVIEILKKKFGFQVVAQKGSHIKLKKENIITIVPNHKELAFGTFRGILKLAHISEKDFWKKI